MAAEMTVMKNERDERDMVMRELAEQFAPIFEQSPDGVYLWLDEHHSICNERLASMFGYTVEEWSAKPPPLSAFAADDDGWLFAWNYQNRIVTFTGPVTFRFRGIRKDGSTLAAETDMIPINWRGYVVVYHFVRQLAQ